MSMCIYFAAGCLIFSVVGAFAKDDGPLILSPLIEQEEFAEARLLSSVDKAMFLGYESYSGYITVKKKYNNNLFFWFFPQDRYCEGIGGKPLIIWLGGGPGYSSMKGIFSLFGPFRIEDGKLKERDDHWGINYSLLFIDNPVGAGFSFSDDLENGCPDNEDDVGDQLHRFLIQFYEMFPMMKKSPLYIVGQSYAGKYIPAMAIQIHNRRKQYPVNLKGIAIGNGLMDMKAIMPHYYELCSILGFLDDSELEKLKAIIGKTMRDLDNKQMVDASNGFNATIEFIKKNSGVSQYNFMNEASNSSKAPDYELFLNRADVRKAIHVGQIPFNLDNQEVYRLMLPDISNSSVPFINELLEHYPVLCYEGQLDIMLGYGLQRHTYNTFRWSRREEFRNAKRKMIRTENGKLAAYIKKGGSLYSVLIRGAGHDAIFDQPSVTKWMYDMFIDETNEQVFD